MRFSEGITARDALGHRIGTNYARWYKANDEFKWRSYGPTKQTICGKLQDAGCFDGHHDPNEHDWGLTILPSSFSRFLLSRDAVPIARQNNEDPATWDCSGLCVDGEVTPHQSLRSHAFFATNS